MEKGDSGAAGASFDFRGELAARRLGLEPVSLETLQINITRLCNQACRHCHVDASPQRREMMPRRTWEQCLAVLERNPEIRHLDITGGAPELHPDFDEIVRRARAMGRHVMVRHNLTVTLDGNPVTGESKEYLPGFFAEQRVEVVSSLPYYQAFLTDRQRGRGVFDKSVESMRRLNAEGYGLPESGLTLNLVYNPAGAYLPPPQHILEADFRRALRERLGLEFNHLFTMTNMPIHRFRRQLEHRGAYEGYMEKLVGSFNAAAAEGVMCRFMISVDHRGRLYDCDFNQMLAMGLNPGAPETIFDFDAEALLARRIRFAPHCFGCTAGAGSSCGGATADEGASGEPAP
ncbi:MAG: arsenosugar biosynthesis radical SAM protein ArsS [Acidobacteriota bacterium]|nr:arsenosugar biosynthesis radical SAM protein ArsS [Acidobacteriota bacterium]